MRKLFTSFVGALLASAGSLVVLASPATAASQTLFTSGTAGPYVSGAVPAGICFVTITADGGHGGPGNSINPAQGGPGARITARFPVTPGSTFDVLVAGGGGTSTTGGDGGFGGGGGGGYTVPPYGAGGGGGASVAAVTGGSVLVVAGGGGGGGWEDADDPGTGGGGGGLGANGGPGGPGAAGQGGSAAAGGTSSGGGGKGGGLGSVGGGTFGDSFINAGGGGGVVTGGEPGGPRGGAGGGGNGVSGGGGGGASSGFNDEEQEGEDGGEGGATGTGLAGVGGGGNDGGAGDDQGGNGGAGGPADPGNTGGGGGGGGGRGFGGGGGGQQLGGGGGGGYGGGGGGNILGGGGGGSSFAASSATSGSSAASALTSDGQVTISYDDVSDVCVPPGPPTNVSVVSQVSGRATVRFSPPVDPGSGPVTGYEADCGGITSTTLGAGLPLHINIDGLANGTQVPCKVRARNDVGYGPFSADVLFTPGVPYGPLSVTGGPGPSRGKLTISWSAANGLGAPILGYLIQCRGWSPSLPTGATQVGGSVRTTLIGGLAPGQQYFCSVTARNSRGWGSPQDAQPVSALKPTK